MEMPWQLCPISLISTVFKQICGADKLLQINKTPYSCFMNLILILLNF